MGSFGFGRVTRHSIILVAAGLSIIAMGVSIRTYVPGGPRWESLVVARNVMPLDAWGILFILVGGAVAILAHWPSVATTWGYTLLTGLCVAWSMFFVMGAIINRHFASDLSQAFVWGLQGFIWWSISGLPDIATSRKARMPQWTDSRKRD